MILRKRSGFTLIELMVVILIIAVLVSLVSSAAMMALAKVPIVKTANEISSMQNGLQMLLLDYQMSSPPPSSLYLREDGQYDISQPRDVATIAFLSSWLGRSFNPRTPQNWNGDRVFPDPPYTLQGQQCLVFFLGGIPSYNSSGGIAMTGFAKTNATPASPVGIGSERKGPYFPFQTGRLKLPPGGSFPVYLDPYETKSSPFYPTLGGTPYAYFSTQGRMYAYIPQDCRDLLANVYYQGLRPPGNFPDYLNNSSYQILSAGADGQFGYDPSPTIPYTVLWLAGGSFATPPGLNSKGVAAGADDQSNFASGLLGSGQQK